MPCSHSSLFLMSNPWAHHVSSPFKTNPETLASDCDRDAYVGLDTLAQKHLKTGQSLQHDYFKHWKIEIVGMYPLWKKKQIIWALCLHRILAWRNSLEHSTARGNSSRPYEFQWWEETAMGWGEAEEAEILRGVYRIKWSYSGKIHTCRGMPRIMATCKYNL